MLTVTLYPHPSVGAQDILSTMVLRTLSRSLTTSLYTGRLNYGDTLVQWWSVLLVAEIPGLGILWFFLGQEHLFHTGLS